MDVLVYIKGLVVSGRIRFTHKAREEMGLDDLDPLDVIESIITARSIAKVLRSKSSRRGHASEKLYVIKSFSNKGTPIYTKGKIDREAGEDVFYVLISAKIEWSR